MKVRVVGPKDKIPEARNTTSSSTTFHKGLSPFFLGPCELYNGHTSKNMENAWQFSKVYKEHTVENEPTEQYFKWARKGWNDSYAHRYPMGKGKKPLYSLWNGEKLDYLEARKQIYIPLYSEAVKSTEAFQKLKEEFLSSKVLYLFDYDGYSDYNSLEEVVNNPKRKMGHAFVLAMLLEGKL